MQFRKEKKIYFQDPFFYSVFKGFTYGRYKDYSENDDLLVEGIICQELASLFRKGPEISEGLWYYNAKKETDFALKRNGSLIGIEVKWSSSVKASEFNNRFTFKERIILSKDTLDYDKEKEVYVVPLSLFLLSLDVGSKIYK
jgi:predicted AAA+ superfamily ATPase